MAGNRGELKRLKSLVADIESHRAQMASLSNQALRNKTWEFRRRIEDGEGLDELLPEAYAVVREAAKRSLGMEHFPVQLMGGIVLHQGGIAQMRTGEGKTLVATLPAYLNALTGKGVHVVTVNDYLAKRDSQQMGEVHRFLGLSVGAVLNGMNTVQRRAAYACDITYVTNSELGFDYLRDNMVKDKAQRVQRSFNYAIIDEVDSVLIDDARTPLVISGSYRRSVALYDACDVLARRMTRGKDIESLSKLDLISGATYEETGDYEVDEKNKQVTLTAEGMRRVERFFRIDNIADLDNVDILRHMNLALKANSLMFKNIDYVVKDDKVFIVDELTGRIMQGRRYSDGLHQAIEAKEKVPINKESRTSATVTYQMFFNKYRKKGGMTGTVGTERKELLEVYGMDSVEIPTNKPVQRIDREDIIFRTKSEKLEAVYSTVSECYRDKRPVLIGTTSVSDSEELSLLFAERGIRHKVLNAKYHELEAGIIADAGRSGAVTIATNMAGRGTDIKLEERARQAGGLLVIGTQRHDSRRIDDQLRGRSGRQGDPGESCFYLSLEDDLLKMYANKKLEQAMERLIDDEKGARALALSKLVAQAQKRVESTNYGARLQVLKYDRVLDKQRELFYDMRNRLLQEKNFRSMLKELFKKTAQDRAEEPKPFPDLGIEHRDGVLDSRDAAKLLYAALMRELEKLEDDFAELSGDTEGLLKKARELFLELADRQWAEQIDAMQNLKDGIGLVSYAQKDPVKEYEKSAYYLFEQMNRDIRLEATTAILKLRPEAEQ